MLTRGAGGAALLLSRGAGGGAAAKGPLAAGAGVEDLILGAAARAGVITPISRGGAPEPKGSGALQDPSWLFVHPAAGIEDVGGVERADVVQDPGNRAREAEPAEVPRDGEARGDVDVGAEARV